MLYIGIYNMDSNILCAISHNVIILIMLSIYNIYYVIISPCMYEIFINNFVIAAY